MKKLLLLLLIFPSFLLAQSFNYLPTSTTKQIVQHTYYTLSYSEDHEQAEWVAYELTKDRVSVSTDRTNDFREDPKVRTGSATLNDYNGSGYDRGHLAPARDMSFSNIAMSESFYMSNMSPQHPSFNRGIWKELEALVRAWAFSVGSIYVITGPIFNGCSTTIGINALCVPEYYYKVIYDNSKQKMISFILPNLKGTQSLHEYVVKTDYLESITNIDFFPFLEDSLEEKLESEEVEEIKQSWIWTSSIKDAKKTSYNFKEKYKNRSFNFNKR